MPENSRLVSLTLVISTVMESILKDQIIAFLEKQSFCTDKQHGFLKGRSYLTNLLLALEDWDESLDQRHSTQNNTRDLPQNCQKQVLEEQQWHGSKPC